MKIGDRILQFLGLQNRPLEGKELEEYQKQVSELLRSQGSKDEKPNQATVSQ